MRQPGLLKTTLNTGNLSVKDEKKIQESGVKRIKYSHTMVQNLHTQQLWFEKSYIIQKSQRFATKCNKTHKLNQLIKKSLIYQLYTCLYYSQILAVIYLYYSINNISAIIIQIILIMQSNSRVSTQNSTSRSIQFARTQPRQSVKAKSQKKR